jgi:hypothetical protein
MRLNLPFQPVFLEVIDAVPIAIIRLAVMKVAKQTDGVFKVLGASGNSHRHEVLDDLEGGP